MSCQLLTTTTSEFDRTTSKNLGLMNKLMGGACATALLIGAAATTPRAALAQDEVADTSGLEEIIVTARKREESLQDTPIAITAFSAGDLAARNLTNLMEVGSFVPNVMTSIAPGGSGGGNNGQIYIRGVGQTDFLFTTDPGVGIYIDGVYHPRTLGAVFDLLDVESIEVLRGPQGTLFGKNTIGGALVVNSAKPTGDGSGYVEGTVGRYNRLDARGSFDISIAEDKLAAKLSFASKNRDGYGKRLDFETGEVLDHTGNENVAAARAAFRWTGSENVTVDLSLDYTREREQSVPTRLMQMEQQALAPLWNFLVADPYPMTSAFITNDPFTTYGTGPNHNDLDLWGAGLTIDWDLNSDMSLKSITAYREMDAVFGRDGDGSPNQYVHTDQDQTQNQFSQELQLAGNSVGGKLDWVAGLYYMKEEGFDHNDVRLASGLYDALEAFPGPFIPLSPAPCPTACIGGAGNPLNALFDLDFDISNWIDIKSYAVFAQGIYDINERLSLTAGIRYSKDKKVYTLEHLRVNAGIPIVPLTTIEGKYDAFTPMGSINYRWSDSFLTYASISRGYKSGGFNGRPTTESAVQAFDPEFVTAYEIGVKSDLLNNTMRLNLAAFFNDYTDIQLGGVSADNTGNLVLIVQNAGKAEVKGFEAELVWQASPNLDITGSLGYTDFGFTKLNPGVVDITLATKQPQTPKWNSAMGVEYHWDIGDDGVAHIRGDWSYRSKVYQEVLNTPSVAQGAFSLFSARFVYENTEQNWELAVFGTNLADKRYIVNGLQALGSFGTAEAFYGRPREWGISFAKRF